MQNITIQNIRQSVIPTEDGIIFDPTTTYILVAGDDDHYQGDIRIQKKEGKSTSQCIDGVLTWLLDNPNDEQLNDDGTMPISLTLPFICTHNILTEFDLVLK